MVRPLADADPVTRSIVIIARNDLRGSVLHTRLLDRFDMSVVFNDNYDIPGQVTSDAGDVYLIDAINLAGDAVADMVTTIERSCAESPLRRVMFFNVSPEANRLLQSSYVGWQCLRGVFAMGTDIGQMMRGIDAVLADDYWLPRSYFSALLHRRLRRSDPSSGGGAPLNDPGLTQKENQILRILVTGKTNEEIASVLNISPHTVKTHVYNLYKKLGVNNRVEASNWAQSNMRG